MLQPLGKNILLYFTIIFEIDTQKLVWNAKGAPWLNTNNPIPKFSKPEGTKT